MNLQVFLTGSVSWVYVAYVQIVPVIADIITAKYLTSGRLFSSGICGQMSLALHLKSILFIILLSVVSTDTQ